jgi:hypothetical protein
VQTDSHVLSKTEMGLNCSAFKYIYIFYCDRNGIFEPHICWEMSITRQLCTHTITEGVEFEPTYCQSAMMV